MPQHPTVELETPDGRTIPIDKDIAELVALLWDANLPTMQSCASLPHEYHQQRDELMYGPFDPDYAWLAFPSMDVLAQFLSIVGEAEDDPLSIWERMAAHDVASPNSFPEAAGQWVYRVLPYSLVAADDWPADSRIPTVPTGQGKVGWDFFASVELPVCDIPELERRLATYIGQHDGLTHRGADGRTLTSIVQT